MILRLVLTSNISYTLIMLVPPPGMPSLLSICENPTIFLVKPKYSMNSKSRNAQQIAVTTTTLILQYRSNLGSRTRGKWK